VIGGLRVPVATATTPAVAALVGYCVATAISATWVSFSFTGIGGPALTFATFLVAQVVFTARIGPGLGDALRFAAAHKGEVLLLNVLTLTSWLFMFMALQRIEASVESAAYQGAVAVVGFVLAAVLSGQRFPRAAVVGIVVSSVLLALLVLARLVAVDTPLPGGSAGTGLALALVAGASGGWYIHRSARLHQATGASATTVLCLRFVLLLVVTGVLGGPELAGLTRTEPGALLGLLALAMAFVVLPTFLLQFAIRRLSSVRVSAATPLVPIIALGSEYVVRPWGSAAAPLIVVAASVALVVTNRALARDTQRKHRSMQEESANAGDDQ
jgi:drug/metabolite transporter (DMT)-like permease